jgi:hypothetical protein
MNKQQDIFSLEYLPLLIRLECKEDARLPVFLGSTLHGVLGWALLEHSNVYTYLFENRRWGGASQDIVNPYMIEPPRHQAAYRAGDQLCFKFILFGNAIRFTKEVVMAMVQAKQFGIGAERKLFELTDILHGERYQPIWKEGRLDMNAAVSENISTHAIQHHASWCSIHMLTPIRIRRGGALVQDINFPTIVRGITRRIQTLVDRYGGYVNKEEALKALELANTISAKSSSLYLNQMLRYSNRKKESLDWSGMLGALTYEDDLTLFTPWLNAARILHIGRNSTFGCGQIDVIYSS